MGREHKLHSHWLRRSWERKRKEMRAMIKRANTHSISPFMLYVDTMNIALASKAFPTNAFEAFSKAREAKGIKNIKESRKEKLLLPHHHLKISYIINKRKMGRKRKDPLCSTFSIMHNMLNKYTTTSWQYLITNIAYLLHHLATARFLLREVYNRNHQHSLGVVRVRMFMKRKISNTCFICSATIFIKYKSSSFGELFAFFLVCLVLQSHVACWFYGEPSMC